MSLSRRSLFGTTAKAVAFAGTKGPRTVVEAIVATPVEPSSTNSVLGFDVSARLGVAAREGAFDAIERFVSSVPPTITTFESLRQHHPGDEWYIDRHGILENLASVLDHMMRSGLKLSDLSQDPDVIQMAGRAVAGKRITSKKAAALARFPSIISKFLDPALPPEMMYAQTQQWQGQLLLEALDTTAANANIMRHQSLVERTWNILPNEHPRAKEITELKQALSVKLEAQRLEGISAAIQRHTSLCAPHELPQCSQFESAGLFQSLNEEITLSRIKSSCILRDTAEGYLIVAPSEHILTVVDVDRLIKNLGRHGRHDNKIYPIDDLKIGVDYVLRATGEHTIDIMTANKGLRDYFKECGGLLEIEIIPRPHAFHTRATYQASII